MPMERRDIEKLILDGIPDAKIELVDLVGDKDHWSATITSAEFAGKSKVQQHQIVYRALGACLGGPLHALQLTTQAPK